MKLCVFGAASNEIDISYIEAAELFGAKMAKRGHTLIFGAGKNGLMGATARGAYSENGRIVGVIPEFFRDEAIEAIFPGCAEIIFTKTMAERKSKMEDLADAFVIMPGGVGTYEELFEVITLKQLKRHEKPIALFDINGYFENLEELFKKSFEERFIRKDCRRLYHISKKMADILDYIENEGPLSLSVHDLKNG